MIESQQKGLVGKPAGESFPDLSVLHQNNLGRVQQLILRGRADELTARLEATHPLFLDVVPLSLEEIFIYELGGVDHEVKEILL